MAGPLTRRTAAEQPGHHWRLVFLEMLKIGTTAFGGGSATIVAMRQMVLRRRWLTEDEFLDTVALSRLTPGITILAQVLLIGRSVCGLRGVLAAMTGMLLPSIVITVGLTRLYQVVQHSPNAAVPLKCLAGAAAGFAIALFLQLLRDTLRRVHKMRGPAMFLVFTGIGLLVNNAEIVLAAAIAAGVAVPYLFKERTEDDEL